MTSETNTQSEETLKNTIREEILKEQDAFSSLTGFPAWKEFARWMEDSKQYAIKKTVSKDTPLDQIRYYQGSHKTIQTLQGYIEERVKLTKEQLEVIVEDEYKSTLTLKAQEEELNWNN